jgi:hypothetical protein
MAQMLRNYLPEDRTGSEYVKKKYQWEILGSQVIWDVMPCYSITSYMT